MKDTHIKPSSIWFSGLVFLLLWLTACSPSSQEDNQAKSKNQTNPELFKTQLYVFGTLADISIWAADKETAEEATAAVAADFQQMHHDWHAWEPGPLVALNAAIATGKTVTVPDTLMPLIERSQEIYLSSEGRFNAGIGRLLNLWGFQSSERPHGPPPSRESINSLLEQHPAMTDLQLQDGVLSSSNPAVQMDFGGIAKGYAVELALQRLQSFGIENAIVNTGGGLGVIGKHDDRYWTIGIRHPQGEGVLASLEIHDGEHMHTSGNYERFREHEGLRYSHILDPRTGWPVDSITSCTVISKDGTLADAAATALVIAGSEDWQAVAKQMAVRYVMLVSEDGTVYMSPDMAERVQFIGQEPNTVLVVNL
ncbi:MAG: FAD:protein FMN transferase [Thiohalomonadaceae bacterium]